MNFCCTRLGTTISAIETPEADGYEASNLLNNHLSGDSSESKSFFQETTKGFRAEHFVKCPVKLVVRFPSCIEISHIIICPKVERQVSSAFMIETETSFKNWAKVNNVGDEAELSKHLVSREYINTKPIPNKIIFRNPRFNLRRAFWKLPSLTQFYRQANPDESTSSLKHPSNYALERVMSLTITILRTEVSSIPAMGSLEIWGQPCVRCPPDQVNALIDICMKKVLDRETQLPKAPSLLLGKHSSSKEDDTDEPYQKRIKLLAEQKRAERNRIESVVMPEDFLDSLTYEVMIQPIRLPSGVAVDSSTLEKYISEEAKQGRLPSDPFTGIVFTDNLKPIADVSLKSRIDLFLTQNADNSSIKNLPRTLGSSKPTSSSVSQHKTEFLPFNKDDLTNTEIENSCSTCKIKFDSTTAIYSAACPHVRICRSCLTFQAKDVEKICPVCSVKWKVKDCHRIYM